MRKFIILLLFVAIPLHGIDTPPSKRRALYHSIDPKSISEHLAFYRLFPDSPEGKRALEDAWVLLSRGRSSEAMPLPYDSLPLVEDLIEVVNRPPQDEAITLSEEEMCFN